jgi:dTDP-4-dehydrorhamnose reductase
MVLRTSIIGEERHKFASLISWVQQQVGKSISGYTNHYWNGVTTTQFGKICQQIMLQDFYKEELYHVFSPASVSKFELVTMISDQYNLGLDIKPEKVEMCDRSLDTVKDLNAKLNIPDIKTQLENMC